MADTQEVTGLDTTDVDRYVGQPIGGGQLAEPVTVTDIRRWVQGMQYPNPLHYLEEYAARSRFGRIVAPQSFAACCDVGQGGTPAIVGTIPGTHVILGGDEWWFCGPLIVPGDHLRQERRFVDYRVLETKFSGPTMFSRGDTLHRNQRGELVAKQRATAVRYLAEEARKRGFYEQAERPRWTPEALAGIERQRAAWIRSRQGGEPLPWEAVEVGQKLPSRPIGPHTVQSLATEWRAFIFTVWGAARQEGTDYYQDAGWLPAMAQDADGVEDDPSLADGLYQGPTKGHMDEEHAQLIGLSREYGYGASMGAWTLDYVASWAGDHGFIRHSNVQYRFPPFEGDVSLLDGEVVDKRKDPSSGQSLVSVNVVMKNQGGVVTAKALLEVELPA